MRSLKRQASRRADPAPSRWRWRMERLWLTPSFRALVRVGLPAAAATALLAGWLGDAERRTAIVDRWEVAVRAVQDRPEFTVRMLRIEGASEQLQSDIQETVAVDLPLSQFQLDLPGMRAQLLSLDPVLDAEVRVVAGGTLLMRVTERTPAVVWQNGGKTEILDATGHRIAAVGDLAAAGGLPLIAGEGAEAAVPEALALVDAAAPIADRMVGLARVGLRRWDVVLTRGQRIALPEEAPQVALDRALGMQAAHDVLARDVTLLDLRIPDRPALRLAPAARSALLRTQARERDGEPEPEPDPASDVEAPLGAYAAIASQDDE